MMQNPPSSSSRNLVRWFRPLAFLVVCFGLCLNRQSLSRYSHDEDGPRFLSASETSSFSGKKIRTFQGKLQLEPASSFHNLRNRFHTSGREFPRFAPDCERWVVMLHNHGTVSEHLSRIESWVGWCTVVVEDENSSDDSYELKDGNKNLFFLSMAQQAGIRHPFVQRILSSLMKDPTQHVARKNIGYLFAIRHGAKILFDFELPSNHHSIREYQVPFGYASPSPSRVRVRYLKNYRRKDQNRLPVFNAIPYMMAAGMGKVVVQRGFPVNATILEDEERIPSDQDFGSIEYSSVGVVHSVCCDDGHVPALDTNPKSMSRVLIPTNHFAPYNFHSTTYLQQAFWGLMLPSTVPEEVADILRAYLTQTFLHELKLALILEPPIIHTDVPRTKQVSLFKSEEAHAWEATKLRPLIQLLASSEVLEYGSSKGTIDSSSWYLPVRIERLVVKLYEHGYIGVEDVHATQDWLLALRDVGYDFPVKEERSKLQMEPSLNHQPYLASPAFNVGRNGRRYMDHVRKSGTSGSLSLYYEWLDQLKLERRKDDSVILKLVTMTKNEWPLIKDWILYHGELIGFENLYILDGSTDSESIAFLVRVRDHLGVNVIFSSAGLNRLETELSAIGREISKASDFVMKFDVDEFLVAHKGDPICLHAIGFNSSVVSRIDCSLSPYVVLETIESLRQISTGERLKVGYHTQSRQNLEVCSIDGNSKNDIALFPLGQVKAVDVFKTISDSRTLAGIDLGGHKNVFAAPFGASKQVGNRTELGVLHFHSRCLDVEVSNCRKAVVSHKFIEEGDTDEAAKKKLREQFGINGDELNDVCQLKKLDGMSAHKALFYLQYLHGCINDDNFYGSIEGSSLNPDFLQFLQEVRVRYGELL